MSGLLTALASILPTVGGGSLTSAVATYTPGSTGNTWTTGQYYGAAFTTTGSGLTVLTLGRYMVLGNTGTHTVVIMDMTGTILGSVSINMTGGTADTFIYTTLGSPLVLSASTQYFIGSQETNGADTGTGSSALTTTAVISSGTWQTYHTVAGLPTNDFDGGNKGYGVSLQY